MNGISYVVLVVFLLCTRLLNWMVLNVLQSQYYQFVFTKYIIYVYIISVKRLLEINLASLNYHKLYQLCKKYYSKSIWIPTVIQQNKKVYKISFGATLYGESAQLQPIFLKFEFRDKWNDVTLSLEGEKLRVSERGNDLEWWFKSKNWVF